MMASKNAPVRILAIQRRLDQGRASNCARDPSRSLLIRRLGHTDRDELGGSLAIANNQLGKLRGKPSQNRAEGLVVGRALSNLDAASGTVREQSNRVVCRGIAVNGDAVERAIDSVLEKGRQ